VNKVCTKCGVEKPVEAFSVDNRSKNGISSRCLDCIRNATIAYRQTDKYKNREERWQVEKEEALVAANKGTRECTQCHQELPLESFRRKSRGKYGKAAECRKCEKKRDEIKYNTSGKIIRQTKGYKDRIKDRRYRNWLVKHIKSPEHRKLLELFIKSEKYDELIRKYRISRKNNRKERASDYQKSDVFKEIVKKYLASDKGRAKRARGNHKRRLRTANAKCTLTAAEWQYIKKLYKNRCVYCGEIKTLEMDHIIPISKGGDHTKENIVPACRSCNAKKGDRPVLLQLLVVDVSTGMAIDK